MRKSPFYHGSRLFLICVEYSFFPKLCSKSFNCYNYFYYLIFVSPLPLHFFPVRYTSQQTLELLAGPGAVAVVLTKYTF